MEKERQEMPMEILDKLREILKPTKFEIVGFEYPANDYITLKIAYPIRFE